MKLIFKDPSRPQDKFCINARTDGDPIVSEGETFEVDDATGRDLLAGHFPRLQPLPGETAESTRTLSAADIIARADDVTDLAKPEHAVVKDNVFTEQEAERPA